ncbi:hypothetical protein [Photobacterium phosphoreum]|uniref:hypothetical protein n=1 Tax=Photobacterium phosphoreum TaxID=659 RepID=UPI001E456AF9|nr:hypothetical protein [Photobacterium phosphoreum]MCD9510129.1 hypothetical protein [Photobacterium phosphoreum]
MKYLNRHFQIINPARDHVSLIDLVLVPDDFYTIVNAPQPGFVFTWCDFEKGVFKEKINPEQIKPKKTYTERYDEVDTLRRTLYIQQVDPLVAEGTIKAAQGQHEVSAQFIQQALALRKKIQDEHPWPSLPQESAYGME